MMDSIRSRILQASYSFLVPIARFLLRSGISFREFEDIAKTAFVHVASEDFGIRGRQTNISRVSAMTGISRKEVRQIRGMMDRYERDLRIELSPLGDILHHWHTDQEFLDDKGAPVPLIYSGPGRSFESLVKRYLGDIPVGAIRAELLRCNAITQNADGTLSVRRREVVPETIDERLISSLSFNLHGLASTIAFNSDPNRRGSGRIERFVQSEHLPEQEITLLRPLLREKITAFTEKIDDVFSRPSNRLGEQKGTRIGVGVYYYEDN